MRLVWTSAAHRDLRRIHDFNTAYSEARAAAIEDSIFSACDGLAHMPRMERKLAGSDVRRWVLTDVQYRIDVDVVTIVGVHHSRENR